MSDAEILGRPLYLPVKHKLKDEQNPLVQPKPDEKKTHLNTDVVYERDDKDWWWCEDV